MSKIKIEAFLSVPACSGGVSLMRLLREIEQEYGDKVEITINKGRNDLFEKNNLSSAPALIIGELVRFMGVCPDKESLVAALKESGLD
ncbi:MAG: thioredoxin family protein [Dehalococcoidales bacterium]|nr:thioredoxin family protein [Dehalococcoidales bacterium]